MQSSKSKRWFVWDGLGITCAMFTYFLIGYAEFVVVGVMLLPQLSTTAWGLFHSILFTILALLAVVAHVRSMVTNPVRLKAAFNLYMNTECYSNFI